MVPDPELRYPIEKNPDHVSICKGSEEVKVVLDVIFKTCKVEIITTMIKSKFCFFQMQIKSMFRDAIELRQTSFCKTPERFDTVDMPFATGKLVVTMMNPEVLIKTDIDQSVIAAPPVRMNFRAIWNNLRIYLPLTLQNTKNNRFAISASTSFTSDAAAHQNKTHRLLRHLEKVIQVRNTELFFAGL